jgi:hypothetical protein
MTAWLNVAKRRDAETEALAGADGDSSDADEIEDVKFVFYFILVVPINQFSR